MFTEMTVHIFLMYLKKRLGEEIVKRINTHDELMVAVNRLLPSLIRESFTESDGKKVMYFYELLERCK